MNNRTGIRLMVSVVLGILAILFTVFAQASAIAQSGTPLPTQAAAGDAAIGKVNKIITLSVIGPSSGDLTEKHVLSIMNPDGGNPTNLVEIANRPQMLALSPDGKLIAYSAAASHQNSLFFMNVNGTGQHQIKIKQAYWSDLYPSWSPDGKKLAYGSGATLMSINIDGTDDHPIFVDGNSQAIGSSAWSPDGKRIVFQIGYDHGHLYMFDLEKQQVSQFTDITTALASNPEWSPDGTKLLFTSLRDDNSQIIYLANADGSNAHALTNATTYHQQGNPVWSPDGTQIAFPSQEGVVVMNNDGTMAHLVLSWKRPTYSLLVWGLIPSVTVENLAPFQTLVPTRFSTLVPFPTITPRSTATMNPNAFDLSTAITYQAPNDVFEMLLPTSWKSDVFDAPRYMFYEGPDNNRAAILYVSIGTPAELNQLFFGSASALATDDLLKAYLNSLQKKSPPNAKFSDIVPVKIGKWDGTGFTLHIPASSQQTDTDIEVRAASLPAGNTIITFSSVLTAYYAKAKPTLDKMLDSLVVHPDLILTSTPRFPTVSVVPTMADDPNAFDLSTATTYKTSSDDVEILLPKTWKATPLSQPGQYAFYYGRDQQPNVVLQILIGTPQTLGTGIGTAATAQDLVQAFYNAFQTQVPPNSKFSEITQVKIGKLDGMGFTLSVPNSGQQPGTDVEIRAAPLSGGKAVLVFARGDLGIWGAAKPALNKMLDSLVINPDVLLPSTPTLSTVTPMPIATVDPNAFDLSTATNYKDPYHSIEIILPKSWDAFVIDRFKYIFLVGPNDDPTVTLQVLIGTPTELNQLISGNSTPISTSDDLLKTIRDSYVTQVPANSEISDIAPAKIGKLDGTGFTLNVPDSSQHVGTDIEVRVAALPAGKAILTIARANPSDWVMAKATTDQMLDGLVVHADVISSALLTPLPLSNQPTATQAQRK